MADESKPNNLFLMFGVKVKMPHSNPIPIPSLLHGWPNVIVNDLCLLDGVHVSCTSMRILALHWKVEGRLGEVGDRMAVSVPCCAAPFQGGREGGEGHLLVSSLIQSVLRVGGRGFHHPNPADR